MEGILFLGITVFGLYYLFTHNEEREAEQVAKRKALERNMICPHCHKEGTVSTTSVKRKVGISGGKATAALLTCGVSLLGTGLSRKQKMTEATCSHCGASWTF